MKPVQPTLDEAIAAARSATEAAARDAVDAAGWDAAVAAWNGVVARLPGGVERDAQALALDFAARTRLRRAWDGGPADDVDVAVELWRRATKAMTAEFSDRAALWSNLGVALHDLWTRDSSAGLLDEAVAAGEAATRASDVEARVGINARLQLGKSLRMRFDDRRQQDDLDRAITVLRDAARAADTSGDATCAECHEALGNCLYDRYQLTSPRPTRTLRSCTFAARSISSLPMIPTRGSTRAT